MKVKTARSGAAHPRPLLRPVPVTAPARWPALRVAMLAPPWISTPPPGYGGVESVVSVLTEALVARGHDVTLFCAPGSESGATVTTLLEKSHPDEIERALYESDHVSRAFAAIDARHPPFDVVHDHCGFTALAMADRLDTPMVHTVHGPFTAATGAFYAHHGHKAGLIGISAAQLASAPAGCKPMAMIRNPIELDAWPLEEQKQDYVLWVGRITPEKGPQRAIAAARMAGAPLVIAGVIQPGQQPFFDHEIAPHIDGSQVRFLGEIGGSAKRSAFAGARALLMPIRWDEPFGMVMVEALACGTPVISFAEGAANELVISGETGFLVPDEVGMAAAIGRLDQIRPRACRAWVATNCDAAVVAAAYDDCYRIASQPLLEQFSAEAV